jgi:hypothetical protein
MEITQIYIVKKGLTRVDNNVLNAVINHLEPNENNTISQLPNVNMGDVFYLNIENIDNNLIPIRTFKSERRNPEKQQIDVLLVISENGFTSKPIRFKQPDPNGNKKDKRVKIIIPNFQWEYEIRTKEQMEQWYNDTEKEGISGFIDKNDFNDWYLDSVQEGTCGYCGLTERECQEIIHKGLLTSLRFPIYKNTSQGVNRGYWLEIDRRNPIGLYSRENCIPSCYFCNNDKSDVFNEQQYREFTRDRVGFIRNLLTETE